MQHKKLHCIHSSCFNHYFLNQFILSVRHKVILTNFIETFKITLYEKTWMDRIGKYGIADGKKS